MHCMEPRTVKFATTLSYKRKSFYRRAKHFLRSIVISPFWPYTGRSTSSPRSSSTRPRPPTSSTSIQSCPETWWVYYHAPTIDICGFGARRYLFSLIDGWAEGFLGRELAVGQNGRQTERCKIEIYGERERQRNRLKRDKPMNRYIEYVYMNKLMNRHR
jgi:hypothetical protein